MMRGLATLLTGLAIASTQFSLAQSGGLDVPKSVEADAAFSIQTSGSGKATLYIAGPAQVLKRDVRLGETTLFPAGSLCNAGRYLVVLTGEIPTQFGQFDVVPASKPAALSFLAKPSRLPVGLRGGITGAVYVFDAYRNLITTPEPVSFELRNPAETVQARTVMTHDGAAFTEFNSSPRQGVGKFVARIGDVSSTRVVDQTPGDPCGLKMSARELGSQLQLQTDPVHDCSGNAVPDGTIVTFSAYYNGAQSTIDVPLKRGIAEVNMRAHSGATISVASGIVMGNQIRWEK